MKALIIDDERIARRELRRLLAAHERIEIVGEGRTGEEALDLVGRLEPDVLFLDVRMPGMSGFDLLQHLDDVPQVIFTTAYDEYALKAFEVSALDYLVKPVSPARLASAVAKLRPRAAGSRLEQVFVKDGERCWLVRVMDISCRSQKDTILACTSRMSGHWFHVPWRLYRNDSIPPSSFARDAVTS